MSQQPETMKEALHKMRSELPGMIEYQMMRAQLCREYYVELVSQGFDKEEALKLCDNFKM